MTGGAPGALSGEISLWRHPGQEVLSKSGHLGEHGAVRCAASAAASRNMKKTLFFE